MTDFKRHKILIVDDDHRNLKLLDAMLRAEGYTTLCASNGQEALRAAAGDAPGLVLLDVMMPEMNGFEVAQKLKSDPLTRDVAIIMATALDDRESRLYAMQVGAEEFLTKPVDRAELLLRVKNVLMLRECRRMMAERQAAPD